MSIWQIHTQNSTPTLGCVVFEELVFNQACEMWEDLIRGMYTGYLVHLVNWDDFENALHFPRANVAEYL